MPNDIDDGFNKRGVLHVARKSKQGSRRLRTLSARADDIMLERNSNASGQSTVSFGEKGNDRNTANFLDAAEFTAIITIGYDWLYDVWTSHRTAPYRHRQSVRPSGLQPVFAPTDSITFTSRLTSSCSTTTCSSALPNHKNPNTPSFDVIDSTPANHGACSSTTWPYPQRTGTALRSTLTSTILSTAGLPCVRAAPTSTVVTLPRKPAGTPVTEVSTVATLSSTTPELDGRENLGRTTRSVKVTSVLELQIAHGGRTIADALKARTPLLWTNRMSPPHQPASSHPSIVTASRASSSTFPPTRRLSLSRIQLLTTAERTTPSSSHLFVSLSYVDKLSDLKYDELQAIAKKHGLRANGGKSIWCSS
ncbi:hypothetical protein M407DRAFT_30083 [Tulasnella calospora MUT 4182]|uniref:Uncharacterized protein n=1 Tax=Tulasnella calospora MUT 4182 TaxID=1051891 RepID=A0A0C3Q7W8_9AGAM|nr:hypothetical protein M407DRAFT_30083 [Tulasnella calospora MUT 4182]